MFSTFTLPDFVPETKFLQDARSHAERLLAKYHSALADSGVKSISSIETGNDIAGKIMVVVDHEHIDLVVMSTQGISGWHPLVFGSIAEKVVELVQCPLLLLRLAESEIGAKISSGRASEWW